MILIIQTEMNYEIVYNLLEVMLINKGHICLSPPSLRIKGQNNNLLLAYVDMVLKCIREEQIERKWW